MSRMLVGRALSAQQFVTLSQFVLVLSFGLSPVLATRVQAQSYVYANIDSFNDTFYYYANGDATTSVPGTTLVADDITVAPGYAGATITNGVMIITNTNSVNLAAHTTVGIWAADGANGGPGTLITGFRSSNTLTYFDSFINTDGETNVDITFTGFQVPANGEFWAGVAFDRTGQSNNATTINELNHIGPEIYNPPDLGTSADHIFVSASTEATGTSFLVSNPVGSLTNFGGSPVANLAWAFQTTFVPAPAAAPTLASGLGILLFSRRRRQFRRSTCGATGLQ